MNLSQLKQGQAFGGLVLFLSIAAAALGNSLTHALGCKYPASVILFYKSFFALTFLLGGYLIQNPFKTLVIASSLKWLVIRSLVGALGVYFWIPSIQNIPLSQASALSLTSSFFSTWGGYLFLKERPTWQKNISLVLGFLGAYLIIHPHFSKGNLFYLYPLVSALCFGISGTLTRYITRNNSEYTVSFYLFLIMTLISIPYGARLPITLWDGAILALIGAFYGLSQLLYAKAYVYAEASYLAPFKYLKAPFHLILGLLFFAEIPNFYDLLGFLIIVIGLKFLLKK